jgi:hypothetical protein
MFNLKFKSITTIAIALTSIIIAKNVCAGTSSYIGQLKLQSFSELAANYDVDFENDQIWFGGKMMSVLDTCMATPTTIRTKTKHNIEILDEDDFEIIGHDYLYKSIYATRAVVDGDDVIDESYTINPTRRIDIVTNDDDFNNDFLFSRIFVTPNC